MNCPACGNELKEQVAGAITVDVCEGGCGGLWFDQNELRKLDEPHESEGLELLDIPRDETKAVDLSATRTCPKCGIPMVKHFHSARKQVEIDECYSCGGIWLDEGELAQIRTLFATEDERKAAAEAYFDDVFGERLEGMRAESEEQLQRARKIANIFRFITPSYWIPGKQDGGAF